MVLYVFTTAKVSYLQTVVPCHGHAGGGWSWGAGREQHWCFVFVCICLVFAMAKLSYLQTWPCWRKLQLGCWKGTALMSWWRMLDWLSKVRTVKKVKTYMSPKMPYNHHILLSFHCFTHHPILHALPGYPFFHFIGVTRFSVFQVFYWLCLFYWSPV